MYYQNGRVKNAEILSLKQHVFISKSKDVILKKN